MINKVDPISNEDFFKNSKEIFLGDVLSSNSPSINFWDTYNCTLPKIGLSPSYLTVTLKPAAEDCIKKISVCLLSLIHI